LIEKWIVLINQSLHLSPRCRELASQCLITKWEEQSIYLSLNHQFVEYLGGATQNELTSALENHFNRKINLQFKPVKFTEQQLQTTPAVRQKQIAIAHKQKLIAQLEQDPFVKGLKETFNAVIDENSVRVITQEGT
jgi:hypothetical protein